MPNGHEGTPSRSQPCRPEGNPESPTKSLNRGLLVYPMQGCVDGISGDHLLIAPPAVITAEQIDWSVQQLKDSIEAVP